MGENGLWKNILNSRACSQVRSSAFTMYSRVRVAGSLGKPSTGVPIRRPLCSQFDYRALAAETRQLLSNPARGSDSIVMK